MPRPIAPFLLAAVGAACSIAAPTRSPEEERAESIVELLTTDSEEWERERDPGDPGLRDAVVARLFDALAESDAEMRSAERRQDATSSEAARARRSRYFAELLRYGEAAARHALREASSAGPRVALATDALARLDADMLRAPLREALREGVADSRRGALRAIAASPERTAEFAGDVTRALRDAEWTVRKQAAATLAVGRGGDDVNAALAAALADPHWLVAREAASALGKRRALREANALVGFLERAKKANDPLAIETAVEALRTMSGRDLPSDPAAWRKWAAEAKPVDERPASAPNAESRP